MCRDAEMATCVLISFIIATTACLSLRFPQPVTVTQVNQPASAMVSSYNSSSIRCEHTAAASMVLDIRLNRVIEENHQMCCQKGMRECPNIIWYEENPNSLVFVLLNITMKNFTYTYGCEVTVEKGTLTQIVRGTPTRLLPGSSKPAELSVHEACPPIAPPTPLPSHVIWILIGLLALVPICSIVVISIIIRRRRNSGDSDINYTYVDMRKAPLATKGCSHR